MLMILLIFSLVDVASVVDGFDRVLVYGVISSLARVASSRTLDSLLGPIYWGFLHRWATLGQIRPSKLCGGNDGVQRSQGIVGIITGQAEGRMLKFHMPYHYWYPVPDTSSCARLILSPCLFIPICMLVLAIVAAVIERETL